MSREQLVFLVDDSVQYPFWEANRELAITGFKEYGLSVETITPECLKSDDALAPGFMNLIDNMVSQKKLSNSNTDFFLVSDYVFLRGGDISMTDNGMALARGVLRKNLVTRAVVVSDAAADCENIEKELESRFHALLPESGCFEKIIRFLKNGEKTPDSTELAKCLSKAIHLLRNLSLPIKTDIQALNDPEVDTKEVYEAYFLPNENGQKNTGYLLENTEYDNIQGIESYIVSVLSNSVLLSTIVETIKRTSTKLDEDLCKIMKLLHDGKKPSEDIAQLLGIEAAREWSHQRSDCNKEEMKNILKVISDGFKRLESFLVGIRDSIGQQREA